MGILLKNIEGYLYILLDINCNIKKTEINGFFFLNPTLGMTTVNNR